jgi:glycine/D-amino acid oxidase-like deaminating enzyme
VATIPARNLWDDDPVVDAAARVDVALPGDADVAIVGGGYTGLWAAHSLLVADPGVRVVVVEREHVGFGASGRNGGWCVGELAGGLGGWIRTAGVEAGVAQTRAIMDTVDVIAGVVAEDGIDCGFAKGGVVRVARTDGQLARQCAEVAEFRHHGFGDDVMAELDADGARDRLAATGVLGGLWYAPGARVHPGRLARGLAAAVRRRGGVIVERTAVTDVVADGSHRPSIVTSRGTCRADVVLVATEAYTRDLPGRKRDLAPLYSLMVATEPLGADVWDEIGLRERETFADDRHMVVYGQRTVDDRIAFGGRGAPYAFGSGIDSRREQLESAHERIAATLLELLPMLRGVELTHRWGGVLGVPRNWRPSVGLDRHRGLAWAGGYVGEGVAASNLAGRTIADLVLGRDTDLVTLPWVGPPSRRWEPEPLRWIGVGAIRRIMEHADAAEHRTGRPSRLAAVTNRPVR